MPGFRLITLALALEAAGAVIAVPKKSLDDQLALAQQDEFVKNQFTLSEATMAEMERNMTIDAAVKVLRGMPKAPAKLTAFVAKKLVHEGRGGFLQTHADPDPGAAAYAEASDTMVTLNNMIEETMGKRLNESLRCFFFAWDKRAEIEESKQDISLFVSRATAARAGILDAQTRTTTFTLKLPIVSFQLVTHNSNCASLIASYQQQIGVLDGDIQVMRKVVHMAECSSDSSGAAGALLAIKCKKHHNVTLQKVSFLNIGGPSEFQKHIASLKSPEAKKLMLKLLDSETKGLGQHRGARQGPFEVDEIPVPAEESQRAAKCSFRDNPNCPKLFVKFENILGGLIDKKTQLEEDLQLFERDCHNIRGSLESSITNFQINLQDAQGDLAKSSKELTDNTESLRQERDHLHDLYVELFREMRECRKAISTFSGELCGLRKIRTEMSKMEGQNTVFYQDCEVGEWIEEPCSRECGGGRQKLYRNITSPPNQGAPCPELWMEKDCNEQRCPIDCKLTDWSGWSECSAECGGGASERGRDIIVTPAYEGEPCEATTDTVACNMQACDADCVLSEWGEWSACSKACGTGHIGAFKSVLEPERGSGTCPELYSLDVRFKRQECNTQECQKAIGAATLRCEAKLDVLIIMDGSSSLGQQGWDATIAAGSALARAMIGGVNETEVAAMVFTGPMTEAAVFQCLWGDAAADPKTVCGIDRVQSFSPDTAALADTIAGMTWPGGSTFTSLALQTAKNMLSDSRPDAASVVVLITDGRPFSPYFTGKAAEELKEIARLFIMPVGSDFDPATTANMQQWASDPADENVVHVGDFVELAAFETVDKIVENICLKPV